MPVLPAMTLASTTVDVAEIYEDGLFDPANPADTLEALNGGLDHDNWDSKERIPCWAVQTGAFARGFEIPFDRWEFIYAKQLANNTAHRITHAGLSARFWLPWAARVVLLGWQAYCRHDATIWSTAGVPSEEYWQMHTWWDGTEITGLRNLLYAGRDTIDAPTLVPLVNDPGIHKETRWPWTSKMSMVKDQAKGYHTVWVSSWMQCFSPDQKSAKLLLPTGSLWVLAIR